MTHNPILDLLGNRGRLSQAAEAMEAGAHTINVIHLLKQDPDFASVVEKRGLDLHMAATETVKGPWARRLIETGRCLPEPTATTKP